MPSAAIIYFVTMVYVVLGMLNEVRPVWYFVLAMVIFVLSQLDFFLLNKVICKVRASRFSSYLSIRWHAHARPATPGNIGESGRIVRSDDPRDGRGGRALPRMAKHHRRFVRVLPGLPRPTHPADAFPLHRILGR